MKKNKKKSKLGLLNSNYHCKTFPCLMPALKTTNDNRNGFSCHQVCVIYSPLSLPSPTQQKEELSLVFGPLPGTIMLPFRALLFQVTWVRLLIYCFPPAPLLKWQESGHQQADLCRREFHRPLRTGLT